MHKAIFLKDNGYCWLKLSLNSSLQLSIALFCIAACCSSENVKEYENITENNTVIMDIFNKPSICLRKFKSNSEQ